MINTLFSMFNLDVVSPPFEKVFIEIIRDYLPHLIFILFIILLLHVVVFLIIFRAIRKKRNKKTNDVPVEYINPYEKNGDQDQQ